MKIASLQEFGALAKHGKFSTAAKACGVSQSALSKHVAELEREVGVELVRRQPTVRLTLAGEHLLERAEEIVFLHDKALAECRKIGSLHADRIVVLRSSITDEASMRLMRACTEVARSGTGIEVGYLGAGTISAMGALDTGKADLVLLRSFQEDMTAYETRGGTVCDLTAIARTQASVWVRADNPLARRGSFSPADLEGVPVIVPAGDAFEAERLTTYSFFERFGVIPRYSFVQVDSIEELAFIDLGQRAYLLTDYIDVMNVMGSDLVVRQFEPPAWATSYLVARSVDADRIRPIVEAIQ